MSWKQAGGRVVAGPPTASGSGSNSNDKRFKQNTGGLNAFQREQQFAAHYGRQDTHTEERGRTDWDVLKENHRFIRDDEDSGDVSWEERLARAYESKLFKEFALIDLKHYKSRRLALRWRTAEEVVEGLGEDTCASLRCKYHPTPSASTVQLEGERRERRKIKRIPKLRAFELPFVYVEMGQRREALVKVRLCARCEGKLTWKPDRERALVKQEEISDEDEDEDESSEEDRAAKRDSIRHGRDKEDTRRDRYRSRSPRRKSRSRSRSPRRDRHLI